MTFACAEPRRPDVVLISLDAVRADAIEATPDASPAMPELARFAGEAASFRRARTPIAFTLPAHMTLLTGLEPESHGVAPDGALGERAPTLAELFRAAGYATVGLHTSEWVKGEFGFARGFDRYEQIPHELTYAPRVAAAALAAIDERREDARPLFLFLHFMDAHSDFRHIGANRLPYYSPAEDRAALGPIDEERDFCWEEQCASDFLVAAETGKITLDRRRIELLRELYRAGLKELDRALGSFFAELAARGRLERAIVVVTSDHGEEFFEHGRYLHSQVYDETSRVPLIVRLPGRPRGGVEVREPVGLADVAPTLVELARLEVDRSGWSVDGRSLAPALRGEGLEPRSYVLRDKLVARRYGLVSGSTKLVVDLADPRPELYDLERDPHERDNVAGARPEVVRRLAAELHRALEGYRDRGARFGRNESLQPFTPEERARLRGLGYLDVVP